MSRHRDNLIDPADAYPYEDAQYEPAPRVRAKSEPRRPCVECGHETANDGVGDLIHVTTGRYACTGKRETVATLTRTSANVPGTDRPKRNWGRESRTRRN